MSTRRLQQDGSDRFGSLRIKNSLKNSASVRKRDSTRLIRSLVQNPRTVWVQRPLQAGTQSLMTAMSQHVSAHLSDLIALRSFAVSTSAANNTVWPTDNKPITGDTKLGKTSSTTPGARPMECPGSCHANHGALTASFAKPYSHTVTMAKELAGLTAFMQTLQKTFKPSR